jgi:hypothetical protein
MRAAGTVAVATLGLVLGASALHAQDRSGYRDFQLGGNVPSVAALAKVPPSDAMTLHQRPSLIQELTWRLPIYQADSIVPVTDPVREIVFSFYNDQLFRMVVTYDHTRTDGLTDADMIAGVSTSYGPPQKAASTRAGALSSVEQESGTLLARWGDAEFSVVLYRSSDYPQSSPARFRLIVALPRLEALTRTASAEAVRLDLQQAPQRESDRRKQDAEDARVAQEKARVANKAAFRP